MMVSTGSPEMMLDGEWKRGIPICEKPCYHNGSRLMFFNGKYWVISISLSTYNVVLAFSYSGTHPLLASWKIWNEGWNLYPKFKFRLKCIDEPVALEDLGDDFFMSAQLTTVVWWINPITQEVEHSGAKEKHGKMGKRWCCICNQAFSANNFKTQHLRIHKNGTKLDADDLSNVEDLSTHVSTHVTNIEDLCSVQAIEDALLCAESII